jgi:hypothetical protein
MRNWNWYKNFCILYPLNFYLTTSYQTFSYLPFHIITFQLSHVKIEGFEKLPSDTNTYLNSKRLNVCARANWWIATDEKQLKDDPFSSKVWFRIYGLGDCKWLLTSTICCSKSWVRVLMILNLWGRRQDSDYGAGKWMVILFGMRTVLQSWSAEFRRAWMTDYEFAEFQNRIHLGRSR